MWIQLLLIAILFLVLLVVILLRKNYNQIYEVYQVNDEFDFTKPSDELYQPLNQLFTTVDNIKDAQLITFTDYGRIDQNIDKLPVSGKTYVYAIQGSDIMADKASLADVFYRNKLDVYIPKTYIFNNQPMQLQEGNIYFLKKNVQRQEGALITRNIEYIKKQAGHDGYVVCQELLQDPFLVDGRKINMRVYMLIVTYPTFKIYYYNNGFIYYAPSKFVKNSIDKDVNITTGYVDREIYRYNPLTHSDLYMQIGKQKSSVLQKNIKDVFTKFKNAYSNTLIDLNKNKKRFNVFGVDIAPDESLGVKIMEINKSPDLSYKDERDANVKLNMVIDMFNLVGILKSAGNKNNFISV